MAKFELVRWTAADLDMLERLTRSGVQYLDFDASAYDDDALSDAWQAAP